HGALVKVDLQHLREEELVSRGQLAWLPQTLLEEFREPRLSFNAVSRTRAALLAAAILRPDDVESPALRVSSDARTIVPSAHAVVVLSAINFSHAPEGIILRDPTGTYSSPCRIN